MVTLDAAFFGNQKRVDGIDSRAHVAQQSGEKRSRHRRRVEFNDFSGKLKLHFAHRAVDELRLKASQLFGKFDVRTQDRQFSRAQRRNVHRAAQSASQQIVAHLFGDSERHAFLRFRSRSAEVRRDDYFVEQQATDDRCAGGSSTNTSRAAPATVPDLIAS